VKINDRETKIKGSDRNEKIIVLFDAPDIFLIPDSFSRFVLKTLTKLIKFRTAISKMKMPAMEKI
jgi:hypothetical protein